MFNRQPFNRGRFNRNNTGRVNLDGKANLCITAGIRLSVAHGLGGESGIILTLKGYKGIPSFIQGNAAISFAAKIADLRRYRALDGKAGICVKSIAYTNRKATAKSKADIVIGSSTSRINARKNTQGSGAIAVNSLGVLGLMKSLQGAADVIFGTHAYIRRNLLLSGNAGIILHATNTFFGLRQGMRGTSGIIFRVTVGQIAMFQYEHIHLPALVIPEGGELLIDTDNMVITLNGQNVMRFLSSDSEFFFINPATNEIVYTSENANDLANINILHKDAWL